MTIGFFQLIIILIVIFLFFGNLSVILNDLTKAIKMLKAFFNDKSKN